MVRFGSVIKVVSVTSSSKQVGETPCLRNTFRQRAMKLDCLSCRSERLMAIRPGCAHGVLPFAIVRAHAVQHPLADVQYQAGLLGERNELRGRDVAVPRQPPAQQRLGAHHAPVAQVHLGLIQDHQLVALQRAAQLALQHQPLDRRRVHLRARRTRRYCRRSAWSDTSRHRRCGSGRSRSPHRTGRSRCRRSR